MSSFFWLKKLENTNETTRKKIDYEILKSPFTMSIAQASSDEKASDDFLLLFLLLLLFFLEIEKAKRN